MGTVKDNERLAEELRYAGMLEHYEVIPKKDHNSLVIAKDMSYFRRVIKILKNY